MKKLRTAVIGCGHLGRIHAKLLSQRKDVELVGVIDPSGPARESVAAECGTRPVKDFQSLPATIDAAVVAAPTSLHHGMTRKLIDAGIHVLVEKPLTPDYQACEELVQRARQRKVVLAVGHVERFNPAFVAAQQRVDRPLYIEATRAGGFSFRSLDVGVVLDLMIHDLELILALVDGSITSVSAVGAPVVTAHEDFAEARVVFSSGCVAELKASRTSPVSQRQMAIYGPEQHVFIDFGARTTRVLQRSSALRRGTLHVDRLAAADIESLKPQVFRTLLPTQELPIADTNPLADELQDFLTSIRSGVRPRVDGVAASRAVWLAEQIVAQIKAGVPRSSRTRPQRAA